MNEQHFVNKAFRVFAVNSILSSAGVVLGTFVDAVILGNALGERGLSALAIAMPIYMIYNLVGFAFGMGGSVKVSGLIGEEDKKGVCQYFSQTIIYALIVGIALMFAGSFWIEPLITFVGGGNVAGASVYLEPVILAAPIFIIAPVLSLLIRSDADPFLSTMGITLSVVVNLLLDLIFILGFNWGIAGAAYAMVAGQLVAVTVYLIHFLKKQNHLKLKRIGFRFSEAQALFRGGFGVASAYVYQGISLIVINHILSIEAGPAGLAVYNILFNVSLFAYAVFDGVSLALAPLVGTFSGEKDTKGVYQTIRLALKTALLLSVLCGFVLFIFAEPISSMFGGIGDPPLVVKTIRILAMAVIPNCFNCVMATFYQTIDHPRFAAVIYLLRGLLLLVLFSVILISYFGVAGTSLAIVAAETMTAVILLIAANVLKKRKGYSNLYLYEEPFISKEEIYETRLTSDLSRLQEIVTEIEGFCEKNEINLKTAYYINLTIEELAANIIKFGFSDGKPHYISIKIAIFEDDIYIRLRDDSMTYNPFEEVEKPDEEMDYLGVSIIRKKAKAFAYNRTLVFNNLLIIL